MEVLLMTFLIIGLFAGTVLSFMKERYILGTIIFIVFVLFTCLSPFVFMAKRDSQMVDVTYAFPAETYDMKTVITSTENTEIDGSDTVRTLKYDTTYVVHGVVPYYHQDDGKKIVKIGK